MFELSLLAPAILFLESLELHEKRQLARLLELIRLDPYIDGRSKFLFPVPPVTVSLYSDERFWIVYHLVDNTRISVWNIGYAKEPPAPRRVIVKD